MKGLVRSSLVISAVGIALAMLASSARAATVTGTLGTPFEVTVDVWAPYEGVETTELESDYTGLIPWSSASGTGSFSSITSFQTYCTQIFNNVYIGSQYTFAVEPLADTPDLTLLPNGGPASPALEQARASAIENLMGQYLQTDILNLGSSYQGQVNSAAMQIAIWDVVYNLPTTFNAINDTGTWNLTSWILPNSTPSNYTPGTLGFYVSAGANGSQAKAVTTAATNFLSGLDGVTLATLSGLDSIDPGDGNTDQDQAILVNINHNIVTVPTPASCGAVMLLLGIGGLMSRSSRKLA